MIFSATFKMPLKGFDIRIAQGYFFCYSTAKIPIVRSHGICIKRIKITVEMFIAAFTFAFFTSSAFRNRIQCTAGHP